MDSSICLFLFNNQTLIQTVAIKEYALNLSNEQLYNYGLIIIHHYNFYIHPEIIIHMDFPKKIQN